MFDQSKPYGECVGGPNHGCRVQNERIYTLAGDEVDRDGNKVAKAAKQQKAEVKKEAEEPKTNTALAAQMNE